MPAQNGGTDCLEQLRCMQLEAGQVRRRLLRLVGLIDQRDAALQRLEERVTAIDALLAVAPHAAPALHGARDELCALLCEQAALRREILGILRVASMKVDLLKAYPLR